MNLNDLSKSQVIDNLKKCEQLKMSEYLEIYNHFVNLKNYEIIKHLNKHIEKHFTSIINDESINFELAYYVCDIKQLIEFIKGDPFSEFKEIKINRKHNDCKMFCCMYNQIMRQRNELLIKAIKNKFNTLQCDEYV